MRDCSFRNRHHDNQKTHTEFETSVSLDSGVSFSVCTLAHSNTHTRLFALNSARPRKPTESLLRRRQGFPFTLPLITNSPDDLLALGSVGSGLAVSTGTANSLAIACTFVRRFSTSCASLSRTALVNSLWYCSNNRFQFSERSQYGALPRPAREQNRGRGRCRWDESPGDR